MQNNIKIGIFDSGMGGTTIFRAIKKELKNADFLYLADSENCPYGEKSDKELKSIVTANVEQLANWGARIIVIACNTATVKCIDYLRQKYPEIEFVGTEPAIKLATATSAKNILVLATPGTVQSERAHELVTKNQRPGQNITLLPCPGLADIIEHTLKFNEDYQPHPLNEEQKSIITQKLRELLDGVTEAPNVIVLGCTHYPLVKEQIQTFFPHASLIDGADGVASRVRSLIK